MRVRSILLGTCVFALITAAALRAEAAPTCDVRLETPSSGEWEEAVRQVQRYTRDVPSDCATIAVVPVADGADVELRTRDGRAARRRIAQPDELSPLVRALLVASPREEEEAAEEEERPTAQATSVAPTPDEHVQQPPPRGPGWLVGAAAGVALPSGDEAAALANVTIGMTTKGWEAGVFGRWELEHTQRDANDAARTVLGAVGGGVMFGRRLAVGPTKLAAGATVAAYSVEVERGRPHHIAPGERTEEYFAEPRTGAYVAWIVPATATIRTRLQLGGELALVEVAPEEPRWHLGITIGFELGRDP